MNSNQNIDKNKIYVVKKSNKVIEIMYNEKTYSLSNEEDKKKLIDDYFKNNKTSNLTNTEVEENFIKELSLAKDNPIKFSKFSNILAKCNKKIAVVSTVAILTIATVASGLSGCGNEESEENTKVENSIDDEKNSSNNNSIEKNIEKMSWEELIALLKNEEKHIYLNMEYTQDMFYDASGTIKEEYDKDNQLFLTGDELMALTISANRKNYKDEEFLSLFEKYNFSSPEDFMKTYYQAIKIVSELSCYSKVSTGMSNLFENEKDKEFIEGFEQLRINWLNDKTSENRDAITEYFKKAISENNIESLAPTSYNAIVFINEVMLPSLKDLGDGENRMISQELIDLLNSHSFPNLYYNDAIKPSGLINKFNGESTLNENEIELIIGSIAGLKNRDIFDSDIESTIMNMIKTEKDMFNLYESITLMYNKNPNENIEKTMIYLANITFLSDKIDNYAYNYSQAFNYISTRILPIWSENGIISDEYCKGIIDSVYGRCEHTFESIVNNVCDLADDKRQKQELLENHEISITDEESKDNNDALIKEKLIELLNLKVKDKKRDINIEERQIKETFGENVIITTENGTTVIYDGSEGEKEEITTTEEEIIKEEAKEEFTDEEIEDAEEKADEEFKDEYEEFNKNEEAYGNGYIDGFNLIYQEIRQEITDKQGPTVVTEDFINYVYEKYRIEINNLKSEQSDYYKNGLDEGIKYAITEAINDYNKYAKPILEESIVKEEKITQDELENEQNDSLIDVDNSKEDSSSNNDSNLDDSNESDSNNEVIDSSSGIDLEDIPDEYIPEVPEGSIIVDEHMVQNNLNNELEPNNNSNEENIKVITEDNVQNNDSKVEEKSDETLDLDEIIEEDTDYSYGNEILEIEVITQEELDKLINSDVESSVETAEAGISRTRRI